MKNFVAKPELAPGELPENSWLAAFAKDPEVALWPVITIVAIVILWLSEQGSQNCLNGKCHQIAPVLKSDDSVDQIIKKLDDGLERHWSFVPWRLAALVAIFVGIMVMVILWKGFPNGLLTFTVFAFIFVGVYFSFNYTSAQVIRPKVEQQRKLLKQLKRRL